MIKLTLPWPPPTNNLYYTRTYRDAKTGKWRSIRGLTTEAQDYKKAVFGACVEAQESPIIGDVGIIFHAYRPRKVGDLDGLFKVIFDALKGAAYLDDGQITKIDAERFEDKKNPRVEIEIYPRSLL